MRQWLRNSYVLLIFSILVMLVIIVGNSIYRHFKKIGDQAEEIKYNDYCRTNLDRLGQLLDQYKAERGCYPASIELLLEDKQRLNTLLKCPSDKTNNQNSYEYVGNLPNETSSIIIMYDRYGNHKDHQNVLYSPPGYRYYYNGMQVDKNTFTDKSIYLLEEALRGAREISVSISAPVSKRYSNWLLSSGETKIISSQYGTDMFQKILIDLKKDLFDKVQPIESLTIYDGGADIKLAYVVKKRVKSVSREQLLDTLSKTETVVNKK